MSHTNDIVIVRAKRTAIGAFQGAFKDFAATQLGAAAIKAVIQDIDVKNSALTDVIMGCVLPAGLGQSPCRQALIHAGIDNHVSALTINKVCGSGLKSVMLAHDLIRAGSATSIIAGGMENMTQAPYLLDKARGGYRMGHGQILDHMLLDGLQDAYDKGTLMGVFADRTAAKYQFTRAQQDDFAIHSAEKALKAQADGLFQNEITPVSLQDKKGTVEVSSDEPPTRVQIQKIPNLRPAFQKDGTVTAANSSSISDGAAALWVMDGAQAQKLGMPPLARIVGHASHSHGPEWFTTAPVGAMTKLMQNVGWNLQDVDLFEINEAFAVVPMAAIHDLKISPDRVNVHGGACALGHPIGASGARTLVTLIHALKHRALKRGIVSLCIGGGEAVAMAVEMC